MKTKTNTGLGQVIVETAYKAARAYLIQHNLKAEHEALMSCVKSWCKIKLPEAITDYEEANKIGMKQCAEQTFLASFALAGIEAAKEAGFPT